MGIPQPIIPLRQHAELERRYFNQRELILRLQTDNAELLIGLQQAIDTLELVSVSGDAVEQLKALIAKAEGMK